MSTDPTIEGQVVARRSTKRRAPWERQDGESAMAFEAFSHYRDMAANERSLSNLIDKHGQELATNWRQCARWSSEWQWVARSLAWDDEQDRVKRQGFLDDIRSMSRRHAQIATAVQGKIIERIQKLKESDVERMSWRDMGYLIDITSKVERMARGLPGEVAAIEHRGEGSDARRVSADTLLDNLSVEKKRELAAMLKEAGDDSE
jgi:hypothetical protein